MIIRNHNPKTHGSGCLIGFIVIVGILIWAVIKITSKILTNG